MSPAPAIFPLPGLPDVLLVVPRRFADDRGWFCETWNRDSFAAVGIDVPFVQDNHSASVAAGTVRGLHFQHAPSAQAKLVRVLRGRIRDVVVDIRPGSPGFGRHASVELDAADGRQLFVPAGFAHGFCTLVPDTEVAYKASAPYDPAREGGILWCDPDLAIPWPVDPAAAVLSPRDRGLPSWADVRASL